MRHLVVLFCLAAVSLAQAPLQSPALLHRIEAGPTLTDLRTTCIGRANCPIPSFAVSGELSLNLNSHWAIDTDVATTPTASNGETESYGGHATLALAGTRASLRSRHYSYFAKGQAGALVWSDTISSVTIALGPGGVFLPTSLHFTNAPRADTAFLYAGGMEYAPSNRIHIRGELGGLTLTPNFVNADTHLHASVGVFVPFGHTLAWQPPPPYNPHADPFWNLPNVIVLGINLLATTADGITTQRFLRRGGMEGNPFARPLVKYGPPGQVSLVILETAAVAAAMYGLNRMHHKVFERAFPLTTAAAHAVLAYRNLGSTPY